MRRVFAVSDWYYRISHIIKRNKFAVLLYVLICLLFLVVGIAVGASVSDKSEFIIRNGASLFKFLRGDIGVISYFFREYLLLLVYSAFATSMFFYRALAFVSLAPCVYKSYVLGMNVSIVIVVFSVSSVPLLMVAFVPICIAEVVILCILSFKCFAFAAVNRCGFPSRYDIKYYYKPLVKYIFIIAAAMFVKVITLALFGSALIGIV